MAHFCPVLAEEPMSLDNLNNSEITVGVLTGSIQEICADKYLPHAKKIYYNSISDAAMALSENKISCFVSPFLTYRKLLELYPSFSYTGDELPGGDIGFAFNKGKSHDLLYSQVNEFINNHREELNSLKKNWLDGLGDPNMPNKEDLENINGHFIVATNTGVEPFTYIENGKITGFEIDVILRFAKEYGYSIDIVDVNFDSLLLGIAQEKYDVGVSTIVITEERKETVRFTDPCYSSSNVVVYNSNNSLIKSENTIFDSIRKTFIEEDRYILFRNGLFNTLEITALSTILGTVLASLICYIKFKGNKILTKLCDFYIQVFEGTPILVLLLVFYYVVFVSSDVNPMLVAIVVFALNSAAFFAESLYSGIKSVDIGQREAGLAMGYSEAQTFVRFILPVAAQTFLPTYQSSIITLLKGTSVVSYITIQDLTKAGEIVRSRTYEALVPLISVAIVYYLLSRLIIFVFKKIADSVKPKRIGKYLKGVDINDKDTKSL